MKKVLRWSIPMTIPLILLGGCTKENSEEIQVVRVWSAEADDTEEARFEKIDDQEIGVGMVTDEGGIEDQSFNMSAWEGLQVLCENKGVTTGYIVPESEAEFYDSFVSMADAGYGLCWGIGYAGADALLQAAADRPDTHFAIVDNAYEETPFNVTAVVFQAQEPSFMVGYIAAAVTHTGKIGFIGGMENEVIDSFRYGYQAGAEYAKFLYGKNVEIAVDYAGSYDDEEKGYEMARQMYADGCDIIFHAAGGTGIGVIRAAKDTGQYVIGVDRDQSDLAPENVLTSALKNVNIAVEMVSETYLRGEDIGGKTYRFGMTEGAVGIPENHSNYRDEIYDFALIVMDKIKSGEIVPPANAEEYEAYLNLLENEK